MAKVVGPHAFDPECEGCRELIGEWDGRPVRGALHADGYSVLLDDCGSGESPWMRRAAEVRRVLSTRIRMPWEDGQALVELAIALPFLMFALLGFTEAALLLSQRDAWAREAANAAELIADGHAPDGSAALSALAGAACPSARPVASTSGSVVTFTLTCTYRPQVAPVFDGLPVTVEGQAVTP